jgi:hypothetical protein
MIHEPVTYLHSLQTQKVSLELNVNGKVLEL